MAETEEVKKCLEFTVTEENEQPLSVYLRIKPPESKDDHPCVCVISETDVEARAPSTSVAFRNNSRRRRPAIYKFSFSHVLSPSSSQGDVFQSTTCPLLERLVNESTSSLIFSFGVTNSGKTFTIEGTRQNSGILPRSLDYVFNSIHKQLSEDVKVRPDKYNDVIVLDEQRSVVEKTMLDELCRSSMSATSDTTSASKTPARSTESTFSADLISAGFSELTDALRLRNRDTSVFTVLNGEADFLVYVSYLEIYNECVYDLLEVSPRKRRQRRALPLSEDKSGNVYIKYLRKVHVGSADDALRALALGKRNRQMATTLFNEESSRSHCIFTIYLIQMSNGKNTMTQMSFVDLAGSERMAKRTVNNTRLKESGNINKSLMTLKNCIATVRYNNTHKANQRIIPYRESKLTRLLQNYFVNRSLLTMIVNVSLDSSAFDETLHVLRFSAIASQVRIPAAVPDTTELSDSFEGGEDDDDDEEFEALIQEIENLQEENFKLKRDIRQHYIDMQFHELHIRETMVAENIQKCLEIEKFHQESVDHERAVMEECENRRLSILRRMMTEAHESELTDLNSEIDQLKQQLQASNSEVNQLKQQLQASSSKVNQLKQELQASNSEVDQLKRQLQASNSEVACKQQVLTEQLSSNGEEVQMLTNHVADFEDEVRDLHLLLNEKDSKLDSLLEENSQLRKSLEDANKQATDGVRELKETKMKLLEYEEKADDANARISELESDLEHFKKSMTEEKKSLEKMWKNKTKEKVKGLQADIGRMKDEHQQILLRMTNTIDMLQTKIGDMENVQCKITREKELAEQMWKKTLQEKEDTIERLTMEQTVDNEQQPVLCEITTNEEADHNDQTASILVHDFETSVHTEVDVTPKAARKKRQGRKRKSDENKDPVQNKKKKCEQMTNYISLCTRSRTAKVKATKSTETSPVKPVKQSTRSRMGNLLDAVLTPITKVRIVLSPASTEKPSADQSSSKTKEDQPLQTQTRKKKTKGLLKSQISWPVAFQGTTNKTIQGPCLRSSRATKK